MGANPQISKLRAKARRAEELAAKLERGNTDSELMRRVIANLRSEAMSFRALITFFQIAEQHDEHRR